jgi:hypothetical protein
VDDVIIFDEQHEKEQEQQIGTNTQPPQIFNLHHWPLSKFPNEQPETNQT